MIDIGLDARWLLAVLVVALLAALWRAVRSEPPRRR